MPLWFTWGVHDLHIVICADSALSYGACEGATGEWRPRDRTDAKVLGMN
jgi:hypothetical protein